MLLHCAAAWPNFLLRVVHPGLTTRFAAHHDGSLGQKRSILVELGRQPPDDPEQAPKRGTGTQLLSIVAAAGAAREELMRLGFEAPSWESVTAGRRPAATGSH